MEPDKKLTAKEIMDMKALTEEENLNDVRSVDEEDLTSIRADEAGLDPEIQAKLEKIRKNHGHAYKNPFHAPPAREGYTQHWVEAILPNGEPNPELGRRLEEDCLEPRKYNTLSTDEKRGIRSSNHQAFKGIILMKRMILCERPKVIADEVNKLWEKDDLDKVEAIGAGLMDMGEFGHRFESEVTQNSSTFYEKD